jgi:MFS family permease
MVQLLIVVYATRILLIDEVLWGLLVASIPITTIVLALPVGKIVDKIDRRIPILISMLIFGLAMGLFVYGDLTKVIATLIIFGAAQVMLNASFSALQTDLTPKEQRGKVNGFMNFSTLIIMAAGSFLGGLLYEHVSPQSPFVIATAAVAPSFFLTLLLVKKPEKQEE